MGDLAVVRRGEHRRSLRKEREEGNDVNILIKIHF